MELTKDTIMGNLNNPEALEDLYHSNKKAFSNSIAALREQETSPLIQYWYARLFYKPTGAANSATLTTYLFTALLIALAWLPLRWFAALALGDVENSHLMRAIPVVFSFVLSLYFLIGRLNVKNIALCLLPHIVLYGYFLFLPYQKDSQSLTNAFLFMPVLLWFFMLFARSNHSVKKMDFGGFLELSGEIIIWTTLFIIGGAIIVALSLALFEAVKINAKDFYIANICTLGLIAAPFVSLLVIERLSRIKLSIIMANIFLPLILISVSVFGVISLFTATKPYENRDIFILYNILMVIVLCVLAFTSVNDIRSKIISVCAYILPAVTIVLDIITISAVIYRLGKYGVTANKITLLGTNIVMLGHLTYLLYLKLKHETEQNVRYLPVYFVWALCVVFVLPFVFSLA